VSYHAPPVLPRLKETVATFSRFRANAETGWREWKELTELQRSNQLNYVPTRFSYG
jgi:hypothetical protein